MNTGPYSGGSDVITGSLLRKERGREEGMTMEADRQRFEDALLLVLKLEEGTMSQGKRGLQELGKTRKWILPQSLQKQHSTGCRHLDFSPARPLQISHLQKCRKYICVVKFVDICYSNNRK